MKKPIKTTRISTVYTVRKSYSKTNLILTLDFIFQNKFYLFRNRNQRAFFSKFPVVVKLIFNLHYNNKLVIYIDTTGKIVSTLILEKGINYKDNILGEGRVHCASDIRAFATSNDLLINNLRELKFEDYVDDLELGNHNINFDNIPF